MGSRVIEILIYSVASMGLAYIVGVSEISYPIRAWLARTPAGRVLVALMECPVCAGTWAGAIFGAVLDPLHLQHGLIANLIVTALYTSGNNLILARVAGISVPGAQPQPPEEHP